MNKIRNILLLLTVFLIPLASQEMLGRIQVSEEEVQKELDRLIIQGQLQEKEYEGEEKDQLRENVKEGIIMRKLLLTLADYRGIEVTEEEVEETLSQARGDYPDEEWANLLEGQLYTAESFREVIRNSLIIDRVIKTEVLDKISVSDEEIQAYYEAHEEDFTSDQGLLPLGIVRGLIEQTLRENKGREETALFMDNLYSRAMFVEGESTPTQ